MCYFYLTADHLGHRYPGDRKSVNGVVLVSSSASTTYDVVSKVLMLLADMRANPLGLLIYDFNAKRYRYYYGKDYYQYYGNYYRTE